MAFYKPLSLSPISRATHGRGRGEARLHGSRSCPPIFAGPRAASPLEADAAGPGPVLGAVGAQLVARHDGRRAVHARRAKGVRARVARALQPLVVRQELAAIDGRVGRQAVDAARVAAVRAQHLQLHGLARA